jgi:hypothetical protein
VIGLLGRPLPSADTEVAAVEVRCGRRDAKAKIDSQVTVLQLDVKSAEATARLRKTIETATG